MPSGELRSIDEGALPWSGGHPGVSGPAQWQLMRLTNTCLWMSENYASFAADVIVLGWVGRRGAVVVVGGGVRRSRRLGRGPLLR